MVKILKIFFKFELMKKFYFFLFLFVLLISAIIGSVFPYFYKLLVDAISVNQYQNVLAIILVFVGFRFLSTILSAISFVFGDIIVIDASIKARVAVFKHLQDLDFVFHNSKSTGSLISVIKRGDGAFFSLH